MRENRNFRTNRPLKLTLSRTVGFVGFILSIALANLSSAQPQGSTPDQLLLDSQRFHYQKAKSALAAGKIGAFDHHLKELGDYPLKQYLEYAHIRKEFRNEPYNQVDQFLSAYPDTFLEKRLRTNLLYFLASRKRWPEFIKYYQPAFRSVSLQCHSLYSQILTSTSETEKASLYHKVADIWNVGKSQPDACDPLFSKWEKAGYRTEAMLWSRFDKLVQAGNTRFAKYLSKYLDQRKDKAELYLKVHREPSLITEKSNFKDKDAATQSIIAHGIQRLSRKKPLEALYHWEMYEAQHIFPKELILKTKLHVVKRLIRTGHSKEALQILSHSHVLRKNNLVEEIIRESLAEQDWHRVVSGLQMLDDKSKASERWQYWAARAQDELKSRLPGYSSSNAIYQSLADNRSFYGFISSDKLSKNYSLLDHSQTVSPEAMHHVASMDGMRRAHELWLIGSTTEAHAEWIHLSNSLDTQELLAVGQLAKQWGWHNTGIQAMISGNLWNQLTVRFPLAYRDEIYKIASDVTIEPTLIYAIARQESAFNDQAKSPVGAMGLMQIMPKTAQFTAKKAGIEHKKAKDLLNAKHNMRLGSEYLNHLLEKFEGNRILAAAAYNAGPHRVSRWLSEQGKEKPVDIWIETIPYKETRHYVQNILCFSVIYSYRLGNPATFISQDEAKRYL